MPTSSLERIHSVPATALTWRGGLLAAAAWLALAVFLPFYPEHGRPWPFTRELAVAATVVAGLLALLALLPGRSERLLARLRRAGPWLIALPLLLGLWTLATAKLRLLPVPFFAPPQALVEVFVDDWPRLGLSLAHSLWLLLNGVAAGAFCGFLAGLAIGWSQRIGYWVHPVLRLLGPMIDGLETVRRFRAEPGLRDVPIVVLSSKEDPQVKAQSFATGANDYLVKLPDKLELLARVRYHSEAHVLRAQRDEAFRFLRESQRQLAEANIQLQKLVAIDSLTGINNRRHFDQTYEGEWLRARRNRQPLALLLCDVDHFKRYNDTYGHLSGDLCLKKVAAVLTEQLKRPADLVARYGGEEFAMVLPETDAEGARKVAEGCRAGVERLQVAHSGSDLGFVTISIGVGSIQPQSGDDHEAFIERTDQALYQAKAEGRNRVHLVEGSGKDLLA